MRITIIIICVLILFLFSSCSSVKSIGSTEFASPFKGVDVLNYISSDYGWRVNTDSFHNGIDITWSGIRGTPILAIKGGIASVNSVHSDFGYHVLVSHGDGMTVLYGHMLSSPTVKNGQIVKQGTILGYVGSSGNSTENHLHLEMHVDGNPVDPKPYLQNAKQ